MIDSEPNNSSCMERGAHPHRGDDESDLFNTTGYSDIRSSGSACTDFHRGHQRQRQFSPTVLSHQDEIVKISMLANTVEDPNHDPICTAKLMASALLNLFRRTFSKKGIRFTRTRS